MQRHGRQQEHQRLCNFIHSFIRGFGNLHNTQTRLEPNIITGCGRDKPCGNRIVLHNIAVQDIQALELERTDTDMDKSGKGRAVQRLLDLRRVPVHSPVVRNACSFQQPAVICRLEQDLGIRNIFRNSGNLFGAHHRQLGMELGQGD